jgi:hypothetical protein
MAVSKSSAMTRPPKANSAPQRASQQAASSEATEMLRAAHEQHQRAPTFTNAKLENKKLV